MNEDVSRSHTGLWRSRWAAVGAALAVTFGGSGAFWVHAEGAPEPSDSFDLLVDARSQRSGYTTAETTKQAHRVGGADLGLLQSPASVEALTAGATFFPITPFRSYDSRRYDDGLLIWGEGVYFDVLTDASGRPEIPDSAVAVTFNLTVTGTFGSYGYLTVFPGGAAEPSSSSINWFGPGLDLANGGVVSLGNIDAPGQIVVLAGSVPDTATDFIIDITGYYAPESG